MPSSWVCRLLLSVSRVSCRMSSHRRISWRRLEADRCNNTEHNSFRNHVSPFLVCLLFLFSVFFSLWCWQVIVFQGQMVLNSRSVQREMNRPFKQESHSYSTAWEMDMILDFTPTWHGIIQEEKSSDRKYHYFIYMLSIVDHHLSVHFSSKHKTRREMTQTKRIKQWYSFQSYSHAVFMMSSSVLQTFHDSCVFKAWGIFIFTETFTQTDKLLAQHTGLLHIFWYKVCRN